MLVRGAVGYVSLRSFYIDWSPDESQAFFGGVRVTVRFDLAIARSETPVRPMFLCVLFDREGGQSVQTSVSDNTYSSEDVRMLTHLFGRPSPVHGAKRTAMHVSDEEIGGLLVDHGMRDVDLLPPCGVDRR